MKTLKELERERNKMGTKLHEIDCEIQNIKTKKIFPQLKKKYEGKYFKCDNSYGDGDHWDLYKKVIKVKSKDFIETISFEKCTHDTVTIGLNHTSHIDMLDEEITEKEFYQAYNKMMKEIKDKFKRKTNEKL